MQKISDLMKGSLNHYNTSKTCNIDYGHLVPKDKTGLVVPTNISEIFKVATLYFKSPYIAFICTILTFNKWFRAHYNSV